MVNLASYHNTGNALKMGFGGKIFPTGQLAGSGQEHIKVGVPPLPLRPGDSNDFIYILML